MNYGLTNYLIGTASPQQYNYVEIYHPSGSDVSTWAAGDGGFCSLNFVQDTFGTGPSGLAGYTYAFNLTLTTISDVAPVPEPGTVALLGAGLFGLVALRRRVA